MSEIIKKLYLSAGSEVEVELPSYSTTSDITDTVGTKERVIKSVASLGYKFPPTTCQVGMKMLLS